MGQRLAAWRATRTGRLALSVAGIAGLVAAAYAAARLGGSAAYGGDWSTPIWPAAGVGVAALFLFGPRVLPAVVIGGLLAADLDRPAGALIAQVLGDTLAFSVAAAALFVFTDGRSRIDRVGDVVAVAVAACLTALISAVVALPPLRLAGVVEPGHLGRALWTWLLAYATGVLLVVPLAAAWARTPLTRPARRKLAEGVALAAALVALVTIVPDPETPYAVFPALVWAAVRFGPRGATAALTFVAAATVWRAAGGDGPFARDSLAESLLATQLFLVLAALVSLTLAAATAARTRAFDALQAAGAEQEALRRVAAVVAREAKPLEVFERVTAELGRLLGAASASVVRLEGDGSGRLVANWHESGSPRLRVGSTVPLDGNSVVAKVVRSGRAERVEDYEQASGELPTTLRSLGYRSAVAAPVRVGRTLWGAVTVLFTDARAVPPGVERRLCDFAELASQALANADAYEKLAASRSRIVAAGDAERRRIERNLHDGAQQRLVALSLQLRFVEGSLDRDPAAARELLGEAQGQLEEAISELRELARGIHPAILTERGLAQALPTLLTRAPVPVEIRELPEERLPASVEAAAYYVVAEAITNVAKYAEATVATVAVRHRNGRVSITVTDNGVGGADVGAGSGLRGLMDRLEALNGRLEVDSPPKRGTRLHAEIPLETGAPEPAAAERA